MLGNKVIQAMEFQTRRIRWLAVGLALFVLPLVFLAAKDGETKLALIFMLVFGLPIFYLYIFCAKIKMSDQSLIVKYSFGEYKMEWSEIERFAIGGGNIKIIARSKTITIPSFEFWSGPNRQDAIIFFNNLIGTNNIEMGGAYLALIPTFRASKNA